MPAGLQNKKSTLDFLNTIGGRYDQADLKLSATIRTLAELGGFLIETATDNLQRDGNVASGATAASMQIVNFDLSVPKLSLEVEILKTYKFLDQGVRGYAGGGRGKYQFKTPYVSKNMATAIRRWLNKRGLKARSYPQKYGAYSTDLKTGGKSGQERKDLAINKKISQAESLKRMSYAVAAAIKRKGIEPTFFFTKAIKATELETKKRFTAALKVDIINSIN